MRALVGWLDNQMLRSAAAPVRRFFPRGYALGKILRQRLIAPMSGLETYQASALWRFRKACLSRPRTACVLEIGSDLEMRVVQALRSLGVGQVLGVSNEEALRTRAACDADTGPPVLFADATALPFGNGTFNHVFSVATVEHLLDLPRALEESARVLKPGGTLYVWFGPIWSAARGHHVWVDADRQSVRFKDAATNPIPDFAHLILTREQMREALVRRINAGLADAVVASVYDTTFLNRLFYHHYMKIFYSSPLSVRRVRVWRDCACREVLDMLQFKYGKETDFRVTNVEVICDRR